MQNKKAGFTLLELLVVVLIIGILAAVAVPQYQKAVLKARMSEMQTIVRKIYDVKQTYQLANNAEPTSFEELDLDFGTIHQTNKTIVYPKKNLACYLWTACEDLSKNIFIRISPSENKWLCCWKGENKKFQQLCQSYFPNGQYDPNPAQYLYGDSQCVVAPF